ncbi:unnamed protein product [Linum tenue]|uniref:Uncharacterized protein n=1 Tax=Linum tenue TaxID=586396 RepID=A0AAV0L9G6_9ROSI|nr:unnamed protein product [Linum tenue]
MEYRLTANSSQHW